MSIGAAGETARRTFMVRSAPTRRHATTDPEARLYHKGLGKEATLCFIGMR
jgi:hypothetical protein